MAIKIQINVCKKGIRINISDKKCNKQARNVQNEGEKFYEKMAEANGEEHPTCITNYEYFCGKYNDISENPFSV